MIRRILAILLGATVLSCTVVMLNKKSHVTVSPDTKLHGDPKVGSPDIEIIVNGDTAVIKLDTIK